MGILTVKNVVAEVIIKFKTKTRFISESVFNPSPCQGEGNKG